MFIRLWLNISPCTSHIVQQAPPGNSPVKTYLAVNLWITSRAIKSSMSPLVHKPVSVDTFRAWSPESYDNVRLSIKNEVGKNTATCGGEENEIKVGKRTTCGRVRWEKWSGSRGETWKMRRSQGISFSLVRPACTCHARLSKEEKSLVRAQPRSKFLLIRLGNTISRWLSAAG